MIWKQPKTPQSQSLLRSLSEAIEKPHLNNLINLFSEDMVAKIVVSARDIQEMLYENNRWIVT